jgi:hypothetical protein
MKEIFLIVMVVILAKFTVTPVEANREQSQKTKRIDAEMTQFTSKPIFQKHLLKNSK